MRDWKLAKFNCFPSRHFEILTVSFLPSPFPCSRAKFQATGHPSMITDENSPKKIQKKAIKLSDVVFVFLRRSLLHYSCVTCFFFFQWYSGTLSHIIPFIIRVSNRFMRDPGFAWFQDRDSGFQRKMETSLWTESMHGLWHPENSHRDDGIEETLEADQWNFVLKVK